MIGAWIWVAAAAGVAIGVQVGVLGRVSQHTHPLSISFILQISGGLAGLIWIWATRAWHDLGDLGLPWWSLPLGLVGWGLVGALGFASARAGAAASLAVVVAAQLVTGLVFDRLTGTTTGDVRHLLGLVMLAGGAVLITAGR